ADVLHLELAAVVGRGAAEDLVAAVLLVLALLALSTLELGGEEVGRVLPAAATGAHGDRVAALLDGDGDLGGRAAVGVEAGAGDGDRIGPLVLDAQGGGVGRGGGGDEGARRESTGGGEAGQHGLGKESAHEMLLAMCWNVTSL